MIILGIETSCDETGAAVLQKKANRIAILSNIVASSSKLQAKYGGVIPEQAAREQIKSIIPVIETALAEAGKNKKEIDAVAVTAGPGLIGSLLVGVETAKTLSIVLNKPLIAVNHLIGHFYANWLSKKTPAFPCIGLLVSGGHTDLLLFKNHGEYINLGGTRDDAAGECFDKCARLLGLPYPGGPAIAKAAAGGNPLKFKLPRPMMDSLDFDFSFSGLKTAVSNLIFKLKRKPDINDLSASIEAAIIDVLIAKTMRAAKTYAIKNIMLAGGVAANEKLRKDFAKNFEKAALFIPPPELCTDNGAMIASAAFFQRPLKNPIRLAANPTLSI